MARQKKSKAILQAGKENVSIEQTFRGKYRGFAVFLICCALLIAAFAVSSVWMQGDGNGWLDRTAEGESSTDCNGEDINIPTEELNHTEGNTNGQQQTPAGTTPVVDGNLSYLSFGESYIHNETLYLPDALALLQKPIELREGQAPAVLILHTHTSEGYLPSGTTYITEPIGSLTYTRDEGSNVIAVGRALADSLQKKGISAIHCTVMHDASGLSGAYERSAETIKKYLEEHPEIVLVIDLHRDAVINSNGEAVNAVTELDGKRVAQVMAVVGSDGNGTAHERWENNLALALQMRSALNQQGALCRPVSLRNASFYQELAPYSLLLEIGTAAGTVDEAIAAAQIVGEVIANLLYF